MQFIFSFLCFKFQQYADSNGMLGSPWFFIIAVCAAVIGLIAAFVGVFKKEK